MQEAEEYDGWTDVVHPVEYLDEYLMHEDDPEAVRDILESVVEFAQFKLERMEYETL